MTELINEKVSMVCSYNRENGVVAPRKMRWQGRDYTITQVSYHHRIREGRKLIHIFHGTDGSSDFKLRLDTETLHWTLEEIYYGATA